MGFVKFKADKIFTGTEFLPEENVLITDDFGIVQEIVKQEDAGDSIRKLNGIISPGFINCHCHLELSHMKSIIPEKSGLIDFVFSVVTKRQFAAEEILDAIEKSEDKMLKNGIVAIGDICNNLDTIHQKQKHQLTYCNFIETSGWLPDIADVRFDRSRIWYDQFIEVGLTTSMVPHAPYSVSENLWDLITPYFRNKVVCIHNQETSFEDELFLQGSGDFVRMYELMKINNSFFVPSSKSSLQTYFSRLKEAASVILVHNTFISKADVAYAKQAASAHNQLLSFCLCVNANLYIEDKLPPIALLKDSGANVVIGTDSLASNWSLSILDEMIAIQKHFTEITLKEMLQWGTLNGAKALQMTEKLGSFENGKQPGIVLIEGIENEKFLADAKATRIL